GHVRFTVHTGSQPFGGEYSAEPLNVVFRYGEVLMDGVLKPREDIGHAGDLTFRLEAREVVAERVAMSPYFDFPKVVRDRNSSAILTLRSAFARIASVACGCPQSYLLLLVNDAGDAGGPFAGQMVGRVEDWRHCSLGPAYLLLPVSVGVGIELGRANGE